MLASFEKPVVFINEGTQLVGMLHAPDRDKPPPGVVFFHGLTASKSEAHFLFVKLARHLAGMGFMVLRFDFRGSGDSGGAFIDMTLSGEISDGIAAVHFLSSSCGADPRRIGLLGLSMGGAVGAVVAGALGSEIKSCVLLNPVGNPLEDLSNLAVVNGVSVQSFPIDWNGFLFGAQFFEDVKAIEPLRSIRNAVCPVLVVNGDADESIHPLRSREYVEAVEKAGGKAELYTIPGADHVFSSMQWEKLLMEKVAGWFGKTLMENC